MLIVNLEVVDTCDWLVGNCSLFGHRRPSRDIMGSFVFDT
jgi:hypothetical protein